MVLNQAYSKQNVLLPWFCKTSKRRKRRRITTGQENELKSLIREKAQLMAKRSQFTNDDAAVRIVT